VGGWEEERLAVLLLTPVISGMFKRGEYGAPAKMKFLWGENPLFCKYFPPPLTREGDKGGGFPHKSIDITA
jgi:hypothetical protein